MKLLRNLLAGLLALAPLVNAQLTCNPIDFVSAPDLSMYAPDNLSVVGGMFRQPDGSFALHQYESFPPYRKGAVIPRFDERFYNCIPSSLKPALPVALTPRLGQFRPGIRSTEYEIIDYSGTGQLAIVALYSRVANHAVTVGLINADLTAGVTATYSVAANPLSFVTADLNGDNRRDIAVISQGANFRTGALSILLGNGDGTFRTGASIPLTDPRAITAADLNGDQRIDLAIPQSEPKNISVLIGNGDGTFRAPALVALDSFPTTIIAADVTGDNRVDLIVPLDGNLVRNLATLPGNGDGTFRAPVLSESVTSTNGLVAADFNKDGRTDIATVSVETSSVSTFLGDGSGRFTVQSRYGAGYSPNSLRVTDFNLDGNPDLIAGTGEPDLLTHTDNSGTVTVFFGRGDGTFYGSPAFVVARNTESFAAADLNADGNVDLAMPGGSESRMRILLGRGDGQFQQPAFTPAGAGGASNNLRSAVAGDFNGDGRPDLAAAGSSGISIFAGIGNGTFQAPNLIATGAPQASIAAGDLNGDNRPDLIATSVLSNPTPGSGDLSVLLANASGGFQAPVRIRSITAPRQVHVADLNGDQRLDLLVVDNGTFNGEAGGLLVFTGNGNGSFQNPVTIAAGRNPTYARIADLNGDSRPDIVVSTQEGEFGFRYAILLSRGAGGFDAPRLVSTGFGPTDIAVADLSGDQKPDLILGHCCGDTDLEMLIANGDGTFQQPSKLKLETTALYAGDLNRDGRADLVTVSSDGLARVLVAINRNVGALTAVSAASLLPGPIAPDALVSAFGAGLATESRGPDALPLPVNLAGTSVVVRDVRGVDRPAQLTYVSPGQVNFLVPGGTALGEAVITITSPTGLSVGGAQIANIVPGIFQLNSGGLAAANVLRVRASGERVDEGVFQVSGEGAVVASPIDLGPEGEQVFLTIFGTGFRRGNTRNSTVKIGGIDTPVLFIGAQPDFPGLDQLNVAIPRALAGAGTAQIELTVAGIRANTVNIAIR